MYHHSHLNKCKLSTKCSWNSFGGISWQKFPLQRIAHPMDLSPKTGYIDHSLRAAQKSSCRKIFQGKFQLLGAVLFRSQRNTGIGVSNPWSSMTIHDHPWPSMTIHDHPWPSMTIHDHPWSSNLTQFIHVFVMQTSNHPPDLHPPSGAVLFFIVHLPQKIGEAQIWWVGDPMGQSKGRRVSFPKTAPRPAQRRLAATHGESEFPCT